MEKEPESRRFTFALAAASVALAALAFALSARPSAAAEADVSFSKDIRPILKANCVKCHGLDAAKPKKKAAAGLRLDDGEAAMKGGRSGQAIVAGDAEHSLLYKLLSGPVPSPVKGKDGKEKEIDPMPKAKKGEDFKPLAKEDVEKIKKWINQGARWDS